MPKNGEGLCNRCGQWQDIKEFFKRGDTKDRHYTLCKTCRGKWQKAYYRTHTEQYRRTTQKYNTGIRLETFRYYSGGSIACTICGESDPLVLCIDHINGGGNQHRRGLRSTGGIQFYRWLRKEGYPEGFQVLCANCNLRKETIRIRGL